jgi:ABC-type multidrug transport system fused ATPase/permease subunit
MRGLGASGRLFELMEARPRFVTLGAGRRLLPTEPPRRIVFQNVSFAYPTRPNSPILQNINLTIEAGTSIAFAGGSGSGESTLLTFAAKRLMNCTGKSTLALLLLRFYAPTSGRILYGDEDLSTVTPESWRDRIAFVDQSPLLWGMTVSENIAYGKPDATFEEIREAAVAANAIDFIETLPQGFDTRISKTSLSGGQVQRLAIARALIKKPKILVMDEGANRLHLKSPANLQISYERAGLSFGGTCQRCCLFNHPITVADDNSVSFHEVASIWTNT